MQVGGKRGLTLDDVHVGRTDEVHPGRAGVRLHSNGGARRSRGRLGHVHLTGRDFAGGTATEYAKAEWG